MFTYLQKSIRKSASKLWYNPKQINTTSIFYGLLYKYWYHHHNSALISSLGMYTGHHEQQDVFIPSVYMDMWKLANYAYDLK